MSLSDQIIQPAQIVGPGNPSALSADEIAALLGFTDAADFTAALAAKIAAATLTTNGDLLTRTAGVPARLGLGSALQVLRTNAGATALEFADPSGGGFAQQIARFSRITSAQGSLSGSYAANTVAYNSEELDEGAVWSNSGGTLTLASGGDGEYDIVVNCHYTGAEGIFILSVNGAGIGWYWYTGAGSGMAGVISVPGVALVATDTVKVEFFSSAAAGNISYQYTGVATTLTDGRTNRITLVRRA